MSENDSLYGFPFDLRVFGNYSINITKARNFFENVLAGQEDYFINELQEVLLSRISQPIADYLANAKFSYSEIAAHTTEIAKETQQRTTKVFEELGFKLLDLRIEGTSLDQKTQERIGEIADVSATMKASQIAGLDYAELQKLKAMRDAARNEGNAGAGFGLVVGMDLGRQQQATQPQPQAQTGVKEKLKALKELFDEGLIDEEDYKNKKNELLSTL